MANSFIQQASSVSVSPGAYSSLAFPSSVAAGDLLVIAWRNTTAANVSNVIDSLGVNGNWTVVYVATDPNTTAGGWAFTFTKASGPCTVRVNWTNGNDFGTLAMGEWRGANTVRVNSAAATGTGTTPTSPAITATAGDLLIGATSQNNGTAGYSAGSGYTLRATGSAAGISYSALEDNLSAAGGAGTIANFTVSASGGWTCGIGSFFNTLFAISGNCGAAGATINYVGPSSGSVVADGSGNYSIPNLSNGTYTIAPSLTGKQFSPGSRVVILVGGNVTAVNFAAFTGGGDEGPGFDLTFRI